MPREPFSYYVGLLEKPNIKAFLKVIQSGESAFKYNVMFPGYPPRQPKTFDCIAGCQHPNSLRPTEDGRQSSAAGAYQITGTTWRETQAAYPNDLIDFYNPRQDAACLIIIGGVGSSLTDIVNGNISTAFHKLKGKWSSFPEGEHPQYNNGEGLARFIKYGGTPNVNDAANAEIQNLYNGTPISSSTDSSPSTTSSTKESALMSIDFTKLANNINSQELDDTTVGWGSRSNLSEESDYIGLKQYIIYLITRYYPQTLIPFVELIPQFDEQSIIDASNNSVNDLLSQIGQISSGITPISKVLSNNTIIDGDRYSKTVNQLNKLKDQGGVDLYNYDPFQEFSDSFNVPNEAGKEFNAKRNLSYKIYGNLVLNPSVTMEPTALSKPGAIGLTSVSIEQGAQSQNGMSLVTVKILDVQGNKLLDPNSPWSFLLNMRNDTTGASPGDFLFRFGWQIRLPKYDANNNYMNDPQAGKFWNHVGWQYLFQARSGENLQGFDSGTTIKQYLSSLSTLADDNTLTFTQNVTPESLQNPGYKKMKDNDTGKVSYKVSRDSNTFDYFSLTLITPEINVNPKDGSIEATLVFRTNSAVSNCLCPITGPGNGQDFLSKGAVLFKEMTLDGLMKAFVMDNYTYAKTTNPNAKPKAYYATSDIKNWLTVLGGVGKDSNLTLTPSDIKITFTEDQKNKITNATNKDTTLLIDWLQDVLASNNMALVITADKNSTGGSLDNGFLIAYDNDKASPLTGTTMNNTEMAQNDITFGDYLTMVEVNKNDKLKNDPNWIGSRLYGQDDVFSFRFQGSLIEEINVEKLNAPNQATLLANQQFQDPLGLGADNSEVEAKKERTTDKDSKKISTAPVIKIADKIRNLDIMYTNLLGLKVKAICHPWIKVARPCYVKGMGFFDGKYTVLKVSHDLGTDGKFTTSISANRIPETNIKNKGPQDSESAMNNPGAYKAAVFNATTPFGTVLKPKAPPASIPANLKMSAANPLAYNNMENGGKNYFFAPVAKLSFAQEKFIVNLHPLYQDYFRSFITAVEAAGTNYKVLIYSGYRTFNQQVAENINNRSNAKAGLSMHNYGLAIDINLISTTTKRMVRKNGWTDAYGVNWGLDSNGNLLDNSKNIDWVTILNNLWSDSRALTLAYKYGLTWGGDSFNTYKDRVHFGLDATFNSSSLLVTARQQFGNDNNNWQGNKITFLQKTNVNSISVGGYQTPIPLSTEWR